MYTWVCFVHVVTNHWFYPKAFVLMSGVTSSQATACVIIVNCLTAFI